MAKTFELPDLQVSEITTIDNLNVSNDIRFDLTPWKDYG